MTVLLWQGSTVARWEDITRIERLREADLLRLWRGKDCVFVGTFAKLEVV